MKLVQYSKDYYYFLTDEEFKAAVAVWDSGKAAVLDRLGVRLPAPLQPMGTAPWHMDKDIFYLFKGPPAAGGWIAVKTRPPKDDDTALAKGVKGGVPYKLFRREAEGEDRDRYEWVEMSPLDPSQVYGSYLRELIAKTTPDDIIKFIVKSEGKRIDAVLVDETLRKQVSFDYLLRRE